MGEGERGWGRRVLAKRQKLSMLIHEAIIEVLIVNITWLASHFLSISSPGKVEQKKEWSRSSISTYQNGAGPSSIERTVRDDGPGKLVVLASPELHARYISRYSSTVMVETLHLPE